MRALVTGISGFAGGHLARLLEARGVEAVPLIFQGQRVDLRDAERVDAAVKDLKPDRVYHLAALASAGRSWQEEKLAREVNVDGTRNLLEALRRRAPEARTLFVSSGSVYGPGSAGRVFREDDELHPPNPYAASKARAEAVCLQFAKEYKLDLRIARPQGHTGPGQRLGFVVPDLASQVAAIAAKKAAPVIKAGNLEVAREFADVRDVVRAYGMIMEQGRKGQVFNLSRNEPHTIREVAEELMRAAGVKAELSQDPALVRKLDESSPMLDVARISALGFRFEVPFSRTVGDVLDEWVSKLRSKS